MRQDYSGLESELGQLRERGVGAVYRALNITNDHLRFYEEEARNYQRIKIGHLFNIMNRFGERELITNFYQMVVDFVESYERDMPISRLKKELKDYQTIFLVKSHES